MRKLTAPHTWTDGIHRCGVSVVNLQRKSPSIPAKIL
jgi:hypothetical protein